MSIPNLFAAAGLLLLLGTSRAGAPPALPTEGESPFVQVAHAVRPSVVSITVSRARGYEISRAQRRHSPAPQRYGSGLILDTEGHVLTNNHVVDEALRIQVILSDGTKHPAHIIGQDPETDLSLIRALLDDPLDLSRVAQFGNSDSVQVGDWVMAIGNPFGLNHTVSVGVISAKGRRFDKIEGDVPPPSFQSFLQTDASINPGNSGGPLVDTQGRVVGINAAYNPVFPGIGFAIPANLAESVVDELRRHGDIVRGYVGIYPQDLTPDLSEALGLPASTGVLVGQVEPDSPAEQGGLDRGDLILRFADRPVADAAELVTMVSDHRPGSEVRISILRDGKAQTLVVVVGKRSSEDSPPIARATSSLGRDWPGLEVENLSGIMVQRLRVTKSSQGVVVSYSRPGGVAQEQGIARGDVILEINRRPVWNTREYHKIVQEAKEQSKPALFLVLKRDEGLTSFVALRPMKR